MNYQVTITRADGHVFNNAFSTIAEVRDFLALTALVLLPRETVSFRVL